MIRVKHILDSLERHGIVRSPIVYHRSQLSVGSGKEGPFIHQAEGGLTIEFGYKRFFSLISGIIEKVEFGCLL